MTDTKLQAAKQLLASGTHPQEVAASLDVSLATLYRWLPVSDRL
jgi:transposase